MLAFKTTPTTIAGAPFQLVLPGDPNSVQNLGSNTFHPKSFAESKENQQHWFYYFVTKITSVLGLIAVIMSIVWCSIALFDDKSVRKVYQTTTFLTSVDKTNIDSWQVCPLSAYFLRSGE